MDHERTSGGALRPQPGEKMLDAGNRTPRTRRSWLLLALLGLVAGFAVALPGCDQVEDAADVMGIGDNPVPLRIGLLLNLTEGAPGRAVERRQAFEMAVQHVNTAGGVFGQPVQVVLGNSTLDPDLAVAEALRMVEDAGVHAIVGPTSSANALAVAERVSGPAGIPTISPSATSPNLTRVDDGDFFFRTALADNAQGPVLARVAREQGFDNVGVLYRNDAYGIGLFQAFRNAWKGGINAVPVIDGKDSYLAELRQSAAGGATALVVLTFESEGTLIVQEALDSGLYSRFAFGDAVKSPDVARAVGGDRLGGMYGTAGAPAPGEAAGAWDAAYVSVYGAPPAFAYVRETYDAVMALALAAQAAGSVDGTAIRDQLRAVGGGPGQKALPEHTSIKSALAALADGLTVDYDGAVTLEWDANGDLRRGHIGVWRFTAGGAVEEVEVISVGQQV